MKHMGRAIKEINRSLRRIEHFSVLLKSLVLLTVLTFVLYVFQLPARLAWIPTLVYFASSLLIQGRIDFVRRVERAYPALAEKLVTARDYQEEENLVLEYLEQDVLEGLKKVKLSSFFSYPLMLSFALLLTISVAASLFLVSEQVRIPFTLDDVFENTVARLAPKEANETSQGDFTGTEESVMQVGDERIEVEINPVGRELDFSDTSETADYRFDTQFPRDVLLSSGASYEREFTEEQQLLIKRYFERTKGG